jgi:hypothetical protein
MGYLEHNLYWLDASLPSLNAHSRGVTSLHLWHQHMGHMSHMALKTHGPSATTGMDFDASAMAIPNTCYGCEMGKSARKPFSGTGRKTGRILEVVHSNLSGPMETRSIQGSLYYTIVHQRSLVLCDRPLPPHQRSVCGCSLSILSLGGNPNLPQVASTAF